MERHLTTGSRVIAALMDADRRQSPNDAKPRPDNGRLWHDLGALLKDHFKDRRDGSSRPDPRSGSDR